MAYARVAVYENSGDYDEVLAKVREGLVPVYKAQPGFQSFLLFYAWGPPCLLTKGITRVSGGAHHRQGVRMHLAPDLALRETVLGEVITQLAG